MNGLTPSRPNLFAVLLVGLSLSLSSCTDPLSGAENSRSESCPDGEQLNPVTDLCVPSENGNNNGGTGVNQGENSGNNNNNGNNGNNDTEGTHPWDGRDALDPWGDESGDGVPNQFDNCPFHYNPDQLDTDGDGIGDVCDNCPTAANADQASHPNNPLDDRGIRMGDACAPGVIYIDTAIDSDNDGIPDVIDNCPDHPNPDQTDTSGDGVGDVCDNCPNHYNPTQTASPGNPVDERGIIMGDACAPEPNNIPICANQTSEFERLDPNVYVLLDLSGSMRWYPHNNSVAPIGQQRWDLAKNGLDIVVDELYDDIRFGVGEFRGGCDSNSLRHVLNVGSHTANTIKQAYQSLATPSGGTPIGPAINQVRNQNRLSDASDPLDDQRSKALLLVFDGEPNTGGACGSVANIENTLAAMVNEGIFTYVVGFAFNSPVLASLAAAGGTNQHYLANDAATLADAMRDVADLLVSCSYSLETPPPDPNKIWVKLGGQYLDRDDYIYDAAQNVLELTNSACQQVRSISADAIDLEIELGCSDECIPEEPALLCDLYYETCGEPYPCDSCSPEICDGQDNNCDGQIDEGCPDCGIVGATCEDTSDCCEPFECNGGFCGHACYPTGIACSTNSQCCSGVCAISGEEERGICIIG